MSRPNVIVQLRNIGETMRRLGYSSNYTVITGYDSNGNDCIRYDWTAPTWAANNLNVIIRALGKTLGGIPQPASWMTPSVVAGQFSDGVFSYEMVTEDVSLSVNSGQNEKFMLDICHVLRGIQQNAVAFSKTAAGTQPIFGGFNGPSDVLGTSVGILLPGSRAAAVGYGS